MDKWPQELYDHVVSFYLKGTYTSNPAFLALATVSRKFQNSVERHTFRKILFTATDSKLDDFTNIFTPRRRSFLRDLAIRMVLPPYPSECFTEFETDQDRRANNEAITAALKRIFCLISTLYDRDDNITPMLRLHIFGPHSPSDKGTRWFLSTKVPPNRPFPLRLDLNAARYKFSLLDLTSDLSDFPPLLCVREFTISGGRRNWSPRAAVLLSTKMVQAKSISWNLEYREDSWGRYYSIDRRFRNELVQSIMSADLPASTTRFSCNIPGPFANNWQMLLPQFITPGDHDPVSCAFRRLTRHCTYVHIMGPIHATFFDPPADLPNGVEQSWNSVETLKATVSMHNPEGKWLFRLENGVDEDRNPLITLDQLPPGYGDTKEELEEREKYYFRHMVDPDIREEPERVIPNDIELNALFTAFARACCRLPKLKEASVEVVCMGRDIWQYEVGCLAPGTPSPRGKPMPSHDINSWRVYFYLHRWQPSKSTLDELKMIGRTRDGWDPVFLWGESM
ncbi:hypothetical protein F5Y00DRAFT_170636 [Daldinia vernicosa]|uniref:uncharacterized protein n=1 Tax=Daldinia vernicosa TaxID=114800 RepID=UPI0020078DB6|nr:uncharacterized protein F5Y00DRAFT_170636 [Daldinia vernicosa]KAI0845396.1 hypothetical protein F5Y00DRAFT_170636 [Daldinia vernicosa]